MDLALIVDQGVPIIQRAARGVGPWPNYLSIGTGTAAPAHGDTALTAPAAEAHVAAALTEVTVTLANDAVHVAGRIVCAGADKDVGEYGLHNAAGLLVGKAKCATPVHLVVGQGINLAFTVPFVPA